MVRGNTHFIYSSKHVIVKISLFYSYHGKKLHYKNWVVRKSKWKARR